MIRFISTERYKSEFRAPSADVAGLVCGWILNKFVTYLNRNKPMEIASNGPSK